MDRSFEGRLFAILELACASRLAAEGDWHREAILDCASRLAAGCSSPPRTALLALRRTGPCSGTLVEGRLFSSLRHPLITKHQPRFSTFSRAHTPSAGACRHPSPRGDPRSKAEERRFRDSFRRTGPRSWTKDQGRVFSLFQPIFAREAILAAGCSSRQEPLFFPALSLDIVRKNHPSPRS